MVGTEQTSLKSGPVPTIPYLPPLLRAEWSGQAGSSGQPVHSAGGGGGRWGMVGIGWSEVPACPDHSLPPPTLPAAGRRKMDLEWIWTKYSSCI